MEDLSQLGGRVGGGRSTSGGSFLYLPLATTASTSTIATTPLTLGASVAYGRSCFLPSAGTVSTSTLPYLHSSRFNAEVGSSFRTTVEDHGVPQGDEETTIKAKIVSHPRYSTLLNAFMDCQKVGAPLDVVERLSAIARQVGAHSNGSHKGPFDPELDQFMEAYCNMLVMYREELTRPLQEATDFLKRIESQFKALTNISSTSSSSRLFSSVSWNSGNMYVMHTVYLRRRYIQISSHA